MTSDSPDHNQVSIRERLEGLLVVRVVIVTLLLGSAVAVDAHALSELSNPKNMTLLGLIVGTYLLTIYYALALRSMTRLVGLACTQLAADMLVTAALVMVTGGLDSLFLFLFYLTIINAAVVVGRKSALVAATAATLSFVGLALISADIIAVGGLQAHRFATSAGDLAYEVAINSAAAYLIAVLAGYLADRLGQATGQLERQQSSIDELRALNANILASLNSGLLTVDRDGCIIFFNRAAEAISGRQADSVYDQVLADIFPKLADHLDTRDVDHGQDAAAVADFGPPHDDATRDAMPDPRLESEYTRPDGQTIHLGFSVSILRNSSGRAAGRIIIFQDLSTIKQLEREKQLSERLAAVGELAAAMAHEIRNPLASISGSVEMLESVGDLDADDASLMQIIVREVDRLDELLTNFLDYSRPRHLELTTTNLMALTTEVLELFERRQADAEVGADFRAPPDTDDAPARVDRQAVRQVLWNLLNNAREAMADQPSRSRIIVELSAVDDHWRLSVADDGPGVDDAVKDRIFEPFFTTKKSGSGLGLATIHRLVEQHDGHIRVGDAAELGGASFEIDLPAAHAPSTGSSEASPAQSSPAQSSPAQSSPAQSSPAQSSRAVS